MIFEGLNNENEPDKLDLLLRNLDPKVSLHILGLMDTSLSKEDFFSHASAINDMDQPEKVGMYQTVDLPVKAGRKATVKCFENGRLTVSVSDESAE